MKKVILIPIIVGSALLVTGGILLGVGLANSASSGTNVTREELLNEDFNNFDFNLDISDLTFVKTNDGTKKIVFQEQKKLFHEFTVEDGTLKVKFKDNRAWNEKWFSFGVNIKVTVYLPETSYGNLKIDSDTGDTNIPEDFTFDSFHLEGHTGDLNMSANVTNSYYAKLSTGDMKLNSITTKEMELKTDTGKMFLTDVDVKEDLAMKISTGDITLNNVHAKNLSKNKDGKGSTGKIKLINTVISENITIRNGTGDVIFTDSDAHDLDVEASTGDVKGTLLTGKLFTAKTSTGHINVPDDDPTGGVCKIKTSTGDINIKIKA